MKNLVASVQSGIGQFASHADIEVQERAVELLQLLGFVEADLRAYQPTIKQSDRDSRDIPGVEGGFELNSHEEEITYPKSLFLFQPLFTAYELNAVGMNAQIAVRIPDGLDLGRDIVPGGGFPVDIDFDVEEGSEDDEAEGLELGEGGGKGMEELRRVLREQEELEKGKGKRRKGKGKKVEGEVMSVEEKEEKAKVSSGHPAGVRTDRKLYSGKRPRKLERRRIHITCMMKRWMSGRRSMWMTYR
jgi:AP-3 complex subunit delta-1